MSMQPTWEQRALGAEASLRIVISSFEDLCKGYAELAGMPGDLNSDLHYEVIAAQLAELWPHYTSTYCIHAHHEDCRETCKVCDEPCLCECHKAVL
jgi:hypothetical protein